MKINQEQEQPQDNKVNGNCVTGACRLKLIAANLIIEEKTEDNK